MRNALKAALLVAPLFIAVQANAATISFQGSGQTNMPVTSFNTALGTLTGVTITTGYFVYLDIVNGIPFNMPGYEQSYNVNGYFGYEPLGLAYVNQAYQGVRLSPMYESIRITGSVTKMLSAATDDLSPFTRPNALPLITYFNGTVTNSNGGRVQTGDGGRPGAFVSGTTFAVTYEYIDAVPEPATWAMMLLGFGMIGAASRYRRRSNNVTYA